MRRGVLVVACVVGMLCVAPMGGAAAVIGDPLVDFNGDGFADLAVGVPGEDANGGAGDTGGVSVIYGSAGGLSATTTPDQFWGQYTPNVEDAAEASDYFGRELAAGS
jgi:FG-GAP repeat